MSKTKKTRKKKVLTALVLIVFCIVLVLGGMMIYGKIQMGKIPELSFHEALEYTTQNNPDAVITVGIIKDGKSSYTVYGADGKVIADAEYTYEIGSITKTFTASLINKALKEGKISLEDTIDKYLNLPANKNYPTIKELLTHTSGYKGWYFETPMISNFFKGRNDYYRISKDMIIKKAESLDMQKNSYGYKYSNFGYAVLGLVLESVYKSDYTALLNSFVKTELNLNSTRISVQSGELGKYMAWKSDDGYIPAGAMTSDISDMLSYAQMNLEKNPYLADTHTSLKRVDASTDDYKLMDINIDEIGMAWAIDKENGIIWHAGGTDNYNSYLAFNLENKTAVVILSNLPPSYRIPSVVLGVKLLLELGA